MRNVLIAGCGYVGLPLSDLLIQKGVRVWGLRRSWTGSDSIPPDLNKIQCSLLDHHLSHHLPPSLDAVVYLVSSDSSDEENYRLAYVEALKSLIHLLDWDSRELGRLVFASSTAVYGQNAGEWVDEDSETKPQNFRGRIMLEAEETARQSGVRTSIVRFSGIYGPGRNSLIEKIQSRDSSLGRNLNVFTNRIHRADCARFIAHLLELPEPQDLYLGTDCEPVRKKEFIRFLAAELGVDLNWERLVEGQSHPGDLTAPVANRRCSNRRILNSGFQFAYPEYRSGYREIIQALTSKNR